MFLAGWDHPFEEIIDLLMKPENKWINQTVILHYLFVEKMHKSRFYFHMTFIFNNELGYKVLYQHMF